MSIVGISMGKGVAPTTSASWSSATPPPAKAMDIMNMRMLVPMKKGFKGMTMVPLLIIMKIIASPTQPTAKPAHIMEGSVPAWAKMVL